MSWLTPAQQRRIGRACAGLLPLGRTYHVGSSLTRERGENPPRDIDLRMMLCPGDYARLTPSQWKVIADAIGRSIEAETGVAPIDFQIQDLDEANREFTEPRSAIFLSDIAPPRGAES